MGDINVFTGPMKSGNSEIMFIELDRQLIAGKNVIVFKPTIDNREGEDYVSTRAGKKIKAININKIDDIENYNSDVYFIDEFQFLQGDINTIERLAEKGKKFYISGLNLTSEIKTFGKMGELMCIADEIHKLTAICEICKCDNAIFSYFKGEKKEEITIGESEYMPVCRKCYNKLMAERGN